MPEDDDDILPEDTDHKTRAALRIQRLAQQKKELAAARDDALAKVADLEKKLATSEKSVNEVAKLQGELDEFKSRESTWEQERAIMAAGISDAEGLEFTRSAWSRLGDEAKAAGLEAWLSDTEKLPRGVQAYLPSEGSAAAPTPNAGVRGDAARPEGQFTGRQLSGMSNADYAKNRAAAYEDMGLAPPRLPNQQE